MGNNLVLLRVIREKASNGAIYIFETKGVNDIAECSTRIFGGGYVKLHHYIIHDNKIGVVVTFFIILSLLELIPPPQFHPLFLYLLGNFNYGLTFTWTFFLSKDNIFRSLHFLRFYDKE